MAHKIMVMVLAIGLFLWFLLQKPVSEESVRPEKTREKKEWHVSNLDNTKTSKESSGSKPQNQPKDTMLTPVQEDRFDMLKKEMATPEYSDDLYIEVSIQSAQLMYCEMFTQGYLRTELKGKIKNKSWDDAYKKHCEDKRKQYPHLLLSTFTGSQLDWLPATSKMGQKFKKLTSLPFQDRKQDAIELTRTVLRSKKAHELQMSLQSYGHLYAFNYPAWLGTNNQSYIQRITQLAFDHLLCEWDPKGLCGPNSTLMAEKCWQTPGDCGLPFHEWFEKNHMPGMKKDVVIVFNNLKAYSQGEDIE